MVNDSTSFVRVRRWYRTLERRDPDTKQTVTYKYWVDWDIGNVDDGSFFVIGQPSQLFSTSIYGDTIGDSRIFVTEETMPTFEIAGAARSGSWGGAVHFKHPNI
jgi:hypothetical protein